MVDEQAGPASSHPNKPVPDSAFALNDETFCRHVDRLKQLQEFFYQEAIPMTTSHEATGLGDISGFYFHPAGRTPTPDEWNRVERLTQAFFFALTPALRRKFLMGGTPWILAWLPLYFLGLAALSICFAIVVMSAIGYPEYVLFLVYLVWITSLGAIGASASIGMNALSIQDDITFDLTNIRLMSLRIALGALFGVVLTLPFGYPLFVDFLKAVWQPQVFYDPNLGVISKQAIILILPFILGFSTSLVLLILSQLVEAGQVFFGRRPRAVYSPQVASPETSDDNSGLKRVARKRQRK